MTDTEGVWTMGLFSWMFADRNNVENLRIGMEAHIPCPDGSVVYTSRYDGYGHFGGYDIYELAADWNREYLSKNPDYVIPSRKAAAKPGKPFKIRISDFIWYPLYADLSIDRQEMVERMRKEKGVDWFEYRQIGIDIACYDEDNEALPFPIKICRDPGSKYSGLPASKGDPEQGYPIYKQ